MAKKADGAAVSTETAAGGTLVHTQPGMLRHAPPKLPWMGPEVGGTQPVKLPWMGPEVGGTPWMGPEVGGTQPVKFPWMGPEVGGTQLVTPEVGDVAVHAPKRVGVLLHAPLRLQPREP